jgi:hypothetical protein
MEFNCGRHPGEKPSGSVQRVIECKGRIMSPHLAANGAYYQSPGTLVEPASLYLEQLKERLAPKAQAASK